MRIRYRYNRFQRIWETGGLACLGLCALCLGINWQRVAAEGLPTSARIGGVAYLALTVFQGFTAVFAHPEPEGKPQKPIYQRPELTPALRRKQRLGLLCPADGRGGHPAGRGGGGLCPGRYRRRLRRPPGPLVRDGGAHRHGPLFGLCHRPPVGPGPAAGLTAARRGGEEELL